MSKVLVTWAGTLTSIEVLEGVVHRGEILLYHGLAALAVGLLDGVLDGVDGFVARQHAADGEEAGLHDGVDAPAHAGVLGHLVAIDHVELEFLVDDLLLHRSGQVVPDLVRPVGAVEQEGGARFRRTCSMSIRSRKVNWWQATKLALVIR